ncbi:MAG: potassium channel family protein [Cyclobacteriaceae bacterium]
MNSIDNMWKSDKGFVWMLVISILTLISSQLTDGVIGESRFIVRVGFFLFAVIAIKSSALSSVGKLIGYIIPFLLLLLAIAMIRTETPFLLVLYSVVTSGFLFFIIILVVNQIFTGDKITVNKIGGGVAAYILLGHLWASLYLTIYIIDPASFQHNGEVIENEDALKHLSYFSFVTLTTIGYGDIIAVNSLARILAILEGLLGQLFPAIFIAKLVSQQIEDSKK